MAREAVCSICGDTLSSGEIVYCKECRTPFHLECFEFTGHCAVYGCSGTDWVPDLAPETLAPEIVVIDKNIPQEHIIKDGEPVPGALRMVATFIDYVAYAVLHSSLTIVSGLIGSALGSAIGGGFSIIFLFICTSYLLLRDSLFGNGQSLGKMIVGIKVVGPHGEPCTVEQSIKRNAILVVGSFLALIGMLAVHIPQYGVLAAIIFSLCSLLATVTFVLIETMAMFIQSEGRRLGDLYADTTLKSRTWKAMELPATSKPLSIE